MDGAHRSAQGLFDLVYYGRRQVFEFFGDTRLALRFRGGSKSDPQVPAAQGHGSESIPLDDVGFD